MGLDRRGRGARVLPRAGAGAARGRRRSLHPRDLPRSQRDRRGDRRRRSLSDLPIVAQMTTEEDGNTLDGARTVAPALEARGATVIGVNCAVDRRHARDDRAHGSGDAGQAGGAAQRRQTARRRRAGIYLVRRVWRHAPAASSAQRPHRRRVLRHGARPYPADWRRFAPAIWPGGRRGAQLRGLRRAARRDRRAHFRDQKSRLARNWRAVRSWWGSSCCARFEANRPFSARASSGDTASTS